MSGGMGCTSTSTPLFIRQDLILSSLSQGRTEDAQQSNEVPQLASGRMVGSAQTVHQPEHESRIQAARDEHDLGARGRGICGDAVEGRCEVHQPSQGRDARSPGAEGEQAGDRRSSVSISSITTTTLVEKMHIPWPKGQRLNVKWLAPEQCIAMLDAAQGLESDLLHLELMLLMRRIEVKRLTLQDVQLNLINVLGKGQAGGKWRNIPWAIDTLQELSYYQEIRERTISAALSRRPEQPVPQQFLVYAQYGWKLGAYQDTAIDAMLKTVAERAGVPEECVSDHVLRRSGAMMMDEAEVPIEDISDMLGHADLKQTSDLSRPDGQEARAGAGEVRFVSRNSKSIDEREPLAGENVPAGPAHQSISGSQKVLRNLETAGHEWWAQRDLDS